MKRKLLFITLLMLFCSTIFGQKPNWTAPNSGNFEGNMTIAAYFEIYGVEQFSEDIEFAAFCGDELRGVGSKPTMINGGHYVSVMQIHGKNNDDISFKIWDPNLREILSTSYTKKLIINDVLPPFAIDFYETYWNFVRNMVTMNESMTIINTTSIDGTVLTRRNFELAAFYGDELRGVGRQDEEGRTYFTIFGDAAETGLLTFKLYDHETDQLMDITGYSIPFQAGGIYGDYDNPEMINFSTKPFVAKVENTSGNTYYTTIADAITAAQPGETVTILAGDHTADITINKAITVEGETDEQGNKLVNITGRVSAHTGATVKNLNVNNTKTGDYDCALNVNGNNIVVDGVKLTGHNAMRYCYANGDITIKNSTINGSNFAVHFDGSEGGNIVFENTDITGWASYASTVNSVRYTDCYFDQGSYFGHRYYNKNISFTDCTFKDGLLIDLRASGSNVAFTDEDMTVAEVKALFKDPYYVANGNVTLNGNPVLYAASANSKYYNTLQECIDDLPADGTNWYVTLRSDNVLTAPITIPADKTMTFALNGFDITYTSDVQGEAMITNNGVLTIEGSDDDKVAYKFTGAPDTNYGKGNYTIYNNGTLTVESGIVENTTDAMSHASYAINTGAGATLNIKGGKVLNLNGHAVRMVSFGTNVNNVNITGGYIEGTRALQVQLPGDATSTTKPEMNLSISGGELKSNEETYNLAIYVYSNGQSAENLNVAVAGGTFNGNVAINEVATKTMKEDAVKVINGTFNGAYGVFSYADNAVAVPVISITGGTFATDYSEAYALDDGYEFVKDETTGRFGLQQLQGLTISTLHELEAFRDAVNAGNTFEGQTVVLSDDVDLAQTRAAENWIPIGTNENPFLGTFDGGNKTISNLNVEGENNVGLFGYATEANIKNVKIVNANVKGIDCVAALIGQGYASTYIDNCHVSGSIKVEGQTNVGGIVGKYYARVTNSSVIGDGVATSYVKGTYEAEDFEGDNIGGIMGHAGENNTHSGNTVKNITISGTRKVGGLIGTTDRATDIDACLVDNVVIGCTADENYANDKASTTTLGGLVGNYYGESTGGTVTNTVVKNVTFNVGNAKNVGPIVGGNRTTPGAESIVGVTASGNLVYKSTITGSTNTYLMNAVAKIGETKYYTLQEAVDAGNGKTINVIGNTTEAINIADNAVIDLNFSEGVTLNGYFAPFKGNLTIKNGTINNENASYSAIEINEGTLVLNDVKVTSKRHGVRIDGDVEATINGGEYRLSATSGTRHAVNVSGDANVTIKAGTFVGPAGTTMDSGSAVCVQTDATVTIEGGDFSKGKNATLGVSGTMIVKGGTFDQDPSAHLAKGYVAVKNGNVWTVGLGVAKLNGVTYVSLQTAIDAAVPGDNTIQLLANIDGDVTILQQEGINIVIDGKKNDTENYTFNGTINIYGNARNTGTETLKIQNVNFYTEDSGRYFIEANEIGQISGTNNFKQYAHNVTVENCNFATSAGNTNNTVVGMRFRQAYNMSAVNCTSDGIFSIMWTTAVEGLTLNKVVATNCKEGITIGGASKEVNIIGGTIINSETYAIRAEGAGSDFTIENSTLVAKVPVVVRKVTDNSKISFTFKGTNTITESNPTNYWFVAGAGAAYQGNENEQLPAITGQVTVVLNDTGLSYDGVYGNYGVAKIGDVVYTTFNDAYNAATENNNVITLLDDITLTETMTIEKAITLDLGTNTVTGADGAIVFNVKAATTIMNGTVIGNKSGTSSGLIDIYANFDLDGVTIETSKIYALRFKAGECTATLTNCNVTGAFKGYSSSVWEIKSGVYKASSTSIIEQLNGSASVSGGTFHYEIKETVCAPGYVVKNNGDDTWTVEYAPAAFVDADNNGTLDEGEAVYGNLDQIFAKHKEGDVYVVLTSNIVANAQVDTDDDAHYHFTTNVAEGVTMDFLFADDWNYIQKMSLGQNITLNAKYLLAWTEFNVSGTINTDYLFTLGAATTIEATGLVNAETGDATVQVKNNATFTVEGELNTEILNVWVNSAKLIVDGEKAEVNASWVDIWDGTPSVTVQNGATLATSEDNGIKASRGGSITVNSATLTGKIQLGHNGESAGELTVTGNSTLSPITLTVVGSTVSGPENLTVTSGVGGYGVNYFDGVYSLVEIEIQETELFEGWNWFSAYVDINGEEGLTKIQNALAGNATLMKSHTAFGTYYNEMWYNNGGEGLSSASVTEMYMIQMKEAMTGENKMQLEGNLVNPSEHTIQLNKNWNWIGYPSNKPINLVNAFDDYNDFTPQNGDRIKSHVGFSQYYGENSNEFGIIGWWGTLNTMTPGLGYMYYRAGEATSFKYNVPADGAKSELRANITADDNYWVPATHRYANNMTMVAMLEGANADNYEVAAFVDGEVRGSARPVYVEPLDAYMFFLTIYGDEVEEMSFRCYDLATGEEYAINDRINYSVDAMLGSIEEPYMFRGTVGIGEATLSEINIYPNPTTTGREISFDATCETVEVFNTLGVKVAEYHYVDTIDAFETAGIYMIRITNNGNVQNCRVVVK